jgi:diadenosine tetraphosphate (Ap4A) HIT family hydrolase
MGDLNKKEWEAVFNLSILGRQILKRNLEVENFWFLLREGKGIRVGKSVDHLHFHLLPYDPGVIKVGETELKLTPLAMARKLRGNK